MHENKRRFFNNQLLMEWFFLPLIIVLHSEKVYLIEYMSHVFHTIGILGTEKDWKKCSNENNIKDVISKTF